MTGSVRVMEGVVQEWDSSNGENVVAIAGGSVANLKSLTGESASLAVGDVVLVMSTGDRFYVFGKATTPGDPGTVPTWTADITALTGQVDTIQTVTIPAVQADVTVVQGDVVELNTVTVPAVQAVADAAQSTADSAATTATTAASDAAAAQAAAVAAQADADALQTALDAAEADIATAQADIAAILPITTTDISDDAITTPKIATGAITAGKIAANTITAGEIAANAITASELAANAVTAGKIAAGTIVAADIASGTITATQIAANAVTAAKIAATAIDGKTITGALFRTAASGQRVEIDSGTVNQIKFYSGAAAETAPANINTLTSAGGGLLGLQSPTFSGSPAAQVTLQNFTSGSQAVMSGTTAAVTGSNWVQLLAGAHALQLNDDGTLMLDAASVVTTGGIQILTAACTSSTAALTTTEIDITGCSITLTTLRANARYVVNGSFYFSANTGGGMVASGKLNIDGTNQAQFANFTGPTTLERANIAQTWSGTLASAGSHTLKLRAVGGATGGGDFRVNPTSTTITVQIFE